VGTVAQISRVETSEGFIGLIAQGERRVQVVNWLDDDPFPRAEVRTVDELDWDDENQPLLDRAEQVVRRTIARASEFVELQWPADIDLADDPIQACWQLAGIAPLGALDQVTLLQSTNVAELLNAIIEMTESAAEMLTMNAAGDDDFSSLLGED
jgi:hypothetical protein